MDRWGMDYNPMDVAWGRPQNRRQAYVRREPVPPHTPEVFGPQTVRATGGGPFDAAYRQNLTTQAGGEWARPGGNLSFNPTGPLNFGTPQGGGNAPNFGLPPTLLSIMGPQPGTANPPPTFAAGTPPAPRPALTLDQYMQWMNEMGFG